MLQMMANTMPIVPNDVHMAVIAGETVTMSCMDFPSFGMPSTQDRADFYYRYHLKSVLTCPKEMVSNAVKVFPFM